MVFNHILRFIVFAVFTSYLLKKNLSTFLLLILTFVTLAFTALMTTEKGNMMWVLLGMFIVYTIVKRKGIVSLRGAVKLSLLLFLPTLIVMFMGFMGSESMSLALRDTMSRTFAGGIQAGYHYLEFFETKISR